MQHKEETTVATGTFELIKGQFSAEEALEIVNDLYSKKINFNERKSFSQEIRFGSKDPNLLLRINELKLSREETRKFIAEAGESGRTLQVSSTINIEIL
jgi:hypothetical protein